MKVNLHAQLIVNLRSNKNENRICYQRCKFHVLAQYDLISFAVAWLGSILSLNQQPVWYDNQSVIYQLTTKNCLSTLNFINTILDI